MLSAGGQGAAAHLDDASPKSARCGNVVLTFSKGTVTAAKAKPARAAKR